MYTFKNLSQLCSKFWAKILTKILAILKKLLFISLILLFNRSSVPDPWHLVWIRIRGSMPLSNGSGSGFGSGFGSGSCYFRHWPSRRLQKNNLLKKNFCLLLFEGTFTSFFKDKKSKRSHKTIEIKVFFYCFCLMIERSGSGSIPLTCGPGSGSGRPKNMGIRWIRIWWIRIRNTE